MLMQFHSKLQMERAELTLITQKLSGTERTQLNDLIEKLVRSAECDLLSKCSTQLITTIATNESRSTKQNSLILSEHLNYLYLHQLKNSQSKNRILQQANDLLCAKLANHETPQLVPSSPPSAFATREARGGGNHLLSTPLRSYKNKEGGHGDNDKKEKEGGSMYQTSMLSRKRGRSSFQSPICRQEDTSGQGHAKKFRSEIKATH